MVQLENEAYVNPTSGMTRGEVASVVFDTVAAIEAGNKEMTLQTGVFIGREGRTYAGFTHPASDDEKDSGIVSTVRVVNAIMRTLGHCFGDERVQGMSGTSVLGAHFAFNETNAANMTTWDNLLKVAQFGEQAAQTIGAPIGAPVTIGAPASAPAAPAAPVAPEAAPMEAAPMDPLTAVLEDVAVLLETWEDKAHPYYADVTALLMKHTGAAQ